MVPYQLRLGTNNNPNPIQKEHCTVNRIQDPLLLLYAYENSTRLALRHIILGFLLSCFFDRNDNVDGTQALHSLGRFGVDG